MVRFFEVEDLRCGDLFNKFLATILIEQEMNLYYRSLMEQGICEGEMVLLRFKFMMFFDINSKVKNKCLKAL